MHILVLSLLCSMQIVFASDEKGITEYEYANRKLVELVAENSIVGSSVGYGDGKNLEEIKSHLTQWEGQIDFTYHNHPTIHIKNMNVLQLACYADACSDQVVTVLCQKGAHPNHRDEGSFPATYCMKNLFNEEFNNQGLRQYNKRKLLALKAAVTGKQKLYLDASILKQLPSEPFESEADEKFSQEYKGLLKDTLFVEQTIIHGKKQ
jgi:hypothetical protein